MNALMYIDGIEVEDVLGLELFLFFWVALFFRVCLEVIVNDAGKGCIADCSCDLFATLYARVFLVVDQLSETTSAEAMVTRLHCHWNRHDFIAEGTGDLLLY